MNPPQTQDAGAKDPPYRDRSLGLVVFGVLVMLMGAFCALLVPLSLVPWWLSREDSSIGTNLAATVPMMVVYAGFAAALLTLGVGSIRARRWARDLLHSVSRIWLLTGVCTMLLTLTVLPELMRNLGVADGLPRGFVLVATAATLGVLSLAYVVLPAALLLFYRSPDVVATCRARDPGPQFTDGCPPRLLTLAVVWALAGVSVLAMPAYNWAFPFFGRLLTGVQGAAPWLVVTVFCLALAWGSYRRFGWAWWGGIAATVTALVASVLTSVRVGPNEFLAALGLPDDQLSALASLSWPSTWVICAGWVVAWGSMLVYLATLRRYFEFPRRSSNG